ncbi:MAG: DivIVA domain-containing protein [Acidimicrobiia bacterium]|nr:DivIVA domain-containing protein [Acidimicrobiia bacterium]
MPLTPIDVTQKTFREKLKGYDEDEVDDFLDEVMVSLREYEQKLRDAEERIVVLEEQLQANRETEDAMRRTFLAAQRTADQIVAEARTEADHIIEGATSQAELVSADKVAERAELDAQLVTMRSQVAEIRERLSVFATSALVDLPDVADPQPAHLAGVAQDPDSDPEQTDEADDIEESQENLDAGDDEDDFDLEPEDLPRGYGSGPLPGASSLTERVAAMRERAAGVVAPPMSPGGADDEATSEFDTPELDDIDDITEVVDISAEPTPTGWIDPPPDEDLEAAEGGDWSGRRPWERSGD